MCTDILIKLCDGRERWYVNDCGASGTDACRFTPHQGQLNRGQWCPLSETVEGHVTGLCIMNPDKPVVHVPNAGRATIFNSIYFERCDGKFKNAIGGVLKVKTPGKNKVAKMAKLLGPIQFYLNGFYGCEIKVSEDIKEMWAKVGKNGGSLSDERHLFKFLKFKMSSTIFPFKVDEFLSEK